MTDESSVSQWIDQVKAGEEAAAGKLWERYFHRLVGLARLKLGDLPRRAADEEDVALSAFNSFFQAVNEGRIPQLEDRDNLWRVLVTITARKVYQFRLHHGRKKRGGAVNVAEMSLASFIAREPTPDFAVQTAEEVQRLLAALPDDSWRELAQWKLEGYTNKEIAVKQGCSLRSIERRLRLIRGYWDHNE